MTNEAELIQGYLQIFADKYKISKREADVITAIVNIKSNIKDIAEGLGLSPSTVNNHLNNIYEKTGASSKAELVSRLLIETLKHYRSCNLLKKTPRVLIVDDEVDLCESTAKILTQKGVKAFVARNTDEALKMLPEINAHFVLSDINMPSKDGFCLMSKAREIYRYHPQFVFMTGFSQYTLPEAQNLGALSIVRKPIDYDMLYDLILENYIENFYERLNYLNIALATPEISVESLLINIKDIGFGGLFLDMPQRKNRVVTSLKPGSRVKLKFSLDNGRSMEAVTEVQWSRETANNNLKPGFALKFLNLAEEDRDYIETYVRENKIFSYIPIGSFV